MNPKDRIIFPLDVDNIDVALSLVKRLKPDVGLFKIGLEFINSMLASLISVSISKSSENLAKIRELFDLLDGNIFWDGKFDDIPNTIGGASKSVVKIGVRMFNVHASAGYKSIEEAVENKGNAKVLVVTVLTSIGKKECVSIFGDEPGKKVVQFARMIIKAGADGIICSPKELEELGKYPEFDCLIKVIPGVRPPWAATGDHNRFSTAFMTILFGATFLVIGRPIREPPEKIGSSKNACHEIQVDIEEAAELIGD